ncbi:hypothetical protein C8Q74DRAFT_1442452 [Fomes fomentarius]|nr:hypothetical protein C8Q74DRAFT_1442452 [Fomes fomentarius]
MNRVNERMAWVYNHSECLNNPCLTAEDVVSLKEFTRTADAHTWCIQKIGELEDRIAALRVACDDPFRSLDADLWSRSPGIVLHGLLLMRVCRHWNTTILRTEAFWSNVVEDSEDLWSSSREDLAYNKARLQLALTHLRAPPRRLTTRGLPVSAADYITKHAQIMSFLRIWVMRTGELETIDEWVRAGLPRLEHLDIAQNPGSRFGYWRLPCLRSQSLPRLHTLSIAGPHFMVKGPFPSLRHLTHYKCKCQRCEDRYKDPSTGTLENVVDALACCGELESLVIRNSAISSPCSNLCRLSSPQCTVHLPALRYLEINEELPVIKELLSHTTFPTETVLDIMIRYLHLDTGNWAYMTFVKLFPENLVASLRAISAAESAHYIHDTAEGKMEVMAYIAGKRRLHISCYEEDENQIDDYFKLFSPVATLAELTLVTREPLQNCLPLLQHGIHTLSLWGADVKRLLLPSLRGSIETAPVFRGLRHLSFWWDGVARDREGSTNDGRYDTSDEDDSDGSSVAEEDLDSVRQTHEPRPCGHEGCGLQPCSYSSSECQEFCAALAPYFGPGPGRIPLESLEVRIVDPKEEGSDFPHGDAELVPERLPCWIRIESM